MSEFEDKSDDELWDELERADTFYKGQILFELGRRKVEEHEHLPALAFYSQAVEVYRGSTFEREYGMALLFKGNAHHAIGEYEEAIELYVECAAITKAFASGKPTVIHVPIDPVANHGGNENKDTPNYDEFRTWYAEGAQ